MKVTHVGDEPTDQYVRVPNMALRDERLSYFARGLYAEMLSHKNGYDFNTDTNNTSRRTALKQLEECGYIRRDKKHVGGGKYEWTLFVASSPLVLIPRVDEARLDEQPETTTRVDSTRGRTTRGSNTRIKKTISKKTISKKTSKPKKRKLRASQGVEGLRASSANKKFDDPSDYDMEDIAFLIPSEQIKRFGKVVIPNV